MRLNGQITATLLAVAFASVACSENGGSEARTTQSKPSAQATPASTTRASKPFVRTTPFSTTRASSVPKRASDKGLIASKPEALKPASFGDGEAAYQAGNYMEGMKVFEQYTLDNPDNPWGHFMLGLSAWKNDDLEKAEVAFEEALRIHPNHVKSLVNLSRVLIEKGRFDESLDKLVHASDIEPDSADVHRVLGRTYAAQGKIDDAVGAYRRAIALDDTDAWSLNNLGFLFLAQGRALDALPVLAKAVELRKDAPVFRNNLGMALEHTGRFTAAAAEYSDALSANPDYEKAQRNLARVEVLKVNGEEPFDRESMAKRFVEQMAVPVKESPIPVAETSEVQ